MPEVQFEETSAGPTLAGPHVRVAVETLVTAVADQMALGRDDVSDDGFGLARRATAERQDLAQQFVSHDPP